jgi:hypothetical protein
MFIMIVQIPPRKPTTCNQITNLNLFALCMFFGVVGSWQWGYRGAVWEPPGLYSTRPLSGGEWYWRFRSQIQHCIARSWSEHLLSIHWQKETVDKPPWVNWRALVWPFPECWAHVHDWKLYWTLFSLFSPNAFVYSISTWGFAEAKFPFSFFIWSFSVVA